MTEKRGFTLIELLIVIAIISILAAATVVATIGIVKSAKAKKTLAAIEMLKTAINAYQADFHRFPPIYSHTFSSETINATTGAATTGVPLQDPAVGSPQAQRIKRNEELMIYLTFKWNVYPNSPYIDNVDAFPHGDLDRNGKLEFHDAWGNILVFNMPGGNHSGDVDEAGATIRTGDNNEGKGSPSYYRHYFDIYSFGPNEYDDTRLLPTVSPNPHMHGDDLVSWRPEHRK